jgi:nitroreductase
VVPNRWAAGAPVIIVACARKKLFPHLLAEPLAGISYHQLDMGMALEHLALRAVELGLGTCFIGWFGGRAVSRILGLPRGWKPLCLVALGYPAGGDAPRTGRLRLDEILSFNRVGTGNEPETG